MYKTIRGDLPGLLKDFSNPYSLGLLKDFSNPYSLGLLKDFSNPYSSTRT